MTNEFCKGCGRKQSWPNWSNVMAFAYKTAEKEFFKAAGHRANV